ncbi:MAG TPA: phosphatidate cytidylyltransferase [Flavobacteriaceae bacterium]|nr:phosphatidate cytidylyltransferase [Flavobacteriaceae bacterium]
MSETTTRIISGVIYAALLLLAILISEYTFLVLVFLFSLVTLYELQKLLNIESYLAYFILVGFILFFNVFHYFNYKPFIKLLMIFTLIVNILLIRDLIIKRKIPLFEERKYLIIIFYLIAAFVFLNLIPYQNPTQRYEPKILIGVFVLIWSNDSFAYLIGKNFGRRKLFERISPNKTVEGFIGGVLCTLAVSYFVFRITQVFDIKIWLGIALVTCIFGTFGDLIQSKLKRQAGVKDSGRIMPGHGGLLDRLDSIIFAATFIYSFLAIVNNVS